MKAVLHHRASPHMQRQLQEAAPSWLKLSVVSGDETAALHRELADADVLLHVLQPADRALIAAAPRLRFIQKIGVGVNTIDLAEARSRRIAVANMPGTNSQAVCEMTLTLMLAALRRIVSFDAATRRGAGWTLPPDATDSVSEIGGATVGLLGFGEVPRRLAPVLKALGAHVLCVSRRPPQIDVAENVDLATLLARSDIMSLHLPLTPETWQILDAPAFASMKRGVVIINTARGGLIDEAALARALQSGQVRAVGLDVFAQEPLPYPHALLELPGVVCTPHVAWLTPQTLQRSWAVAFENCRRLRNDEPLLYQVQA